MKGEGVLSLVVKKAKLKEGMACGGYGCGFSFAYSPLQERQLLIFSCVLLLPFSFSNKNTIFFFPIFRVKKTCQSVLFVRFFFSVLFVLNYSSGSSSFLSTN